MNIFVGVVALIRLFLRRDRVRLPIWIVALVGITYASAAAVPGVYDTPAKIQSYADNIGASPASIAMAGPPVALNTIQGIIVYETSLTVLIGVALMALFTVVRHTRGEEEVGRTELLGAAVVGRHAGTAAAVIVAAGATVAVGFGVALSVLAQSFPVNAALLFGAAVAALGLVFAALAAVSAQLLTHARTAIGVSLAALGVCFALRALGDVRESALSWFSPIGWSQQVRVGEANRWWPLLMSVALVAVLLVVAGWLTTRRDLGAGVVASRPGPAHASRSLGSILGLAWRLQRGSVIAWSAGLFLFGMLFGSFSNELQRMVEDNPLLEEYFRRVGGSVTDSLFATSMLLTGILAAGFAVGSALRLHGEETAGRLESVLAGPVPRARALLAPLVVTVAGSVVLVSFGGLGLGIADALVGSEPASILELVALSWVQLPAILVLAAAAVFLTGWQPRMTGVVWFALGVSFLIGWLGGLLDPPGWVLDLSPFEHLPFVPVEDMAVLPIVVLTLLAVAMTAVGLVGFRRRDLS